MSAGGVNALGRLSRTKLVRGQYPKTAVANEFANGHDDEQDGPRTLSSRSNKFLPSLDDEKTDSVTSSMLARQQKQPCVSQKVDRSGLAFKSASAPR